MEIIKLKCESTELPKEIEIRQLSGGLYEFIGHTNIVETIKDDMPIWESDMTHITTKINADSDKIGFCVKLRYSIDDEMSLINKGIADSSNAEYLAYRAYVAQCKEACKS